AMARANLKEPPAAWRDSLVQVLGCRDSNLVGTAASTARSWSLGPDNAGELGAALRKVGSDSSLPVQIRLEALAAVPGHLTPVEPELFQFLRHHLAPSNPVLVRSTAAEVLAKAALNPEQLSSLTESVQTSGPMEVPKLLSAFDKATDEDLGMKLIHALEKSTG